MKYSLPEGTIMAEKGEKMRSILQMITLLLLLATVFACESPGAETAFVHAPTGLSNQVMINGAALDVFQTSDIFYYTDGSRLTTLYFRTGTSFVFIDLYHKNQTGQLPLGAWNALDAGDFWLFRCTNQGIITEVNLSSTGVTIDIAVSGNDGGTLSIDGTLEFEGFICSFNYVGVYNYTPD